MPLITHSAPLLYIVGKDPQAELGAGHSSCVRSHILAANQAGFKPHILCISDKNEVCEVDYGIIHRIKSPLGPLYSKIYPVAIKTRGYISHRRTLVKWIRNWLKSHPEPVIIHGFSLWAEAGSKAVQQANRTENVKVYSNQYTLHNQEYLSKLQGAPKGMSRVKALYAYDYMVSRLFLTRYERSLFQSEAEILVNYDSVIRLIESTQGPPKRVRKIPYCTELGFRDPVTTIQPTLPYPLEEGPPLIVSVSRHDGRKGLDVFLQALHRLKSNVTEFNAVLIGSGEIIEQNKKLLRELHLESCTSIPGYVSDILP